MAKPISWMLLLSRVAYSTATMCWPFSCTSMISPVAMSICSQPMAGSPPMSTYSVGTATTWRGLAVKSAVMRALAMEEMGSASSWSSWVTVYMPSGMFCASAAARIAATLVTGSMPISSRICDSRLISNRPRAMLKVRRPSSVWPG